MSFQVEKLNLPIVEVLPEILGTLSENRCLILTAETGAGKTTVVPLALMEESWLAGQKILMLEPRRVAALAAARRMAQLLGESPGQSVGWRMSQETCVSSRTRIEVITEGVLTRILQNDPGLENVGLVLFDEFHERTLAGDLGLALALDVKKHFRPDLRLGVLSATLDVDALGFLLEGSHAVHSKGRLFPVETTYKPPREGQDLLDAVVSQVAEGWSQTEGDVLVFLPGWAEIQKVSQRLSVFSKQTGEVVMGLHGNQCAQDQARALEPLPSGKRKTVLSTSVAETSVTLPGVTLVIDAGLSRLNRFEPKRGMDRLVTERLTKASAEQRRGRAGRTQAGRCWRLWNAAEPLEEFSSPEIVRADLSSLVLECAEWGVHRPEELVWLTAPPDSLWNQGRDLLKLLGALDETGRLTSHGRELHKLGKGPRLGNMLVEAQIGGQLEMALACAALLGERDLLTGVSDPDFRLRLEALFGDRRFAVSTSILERAKESIVQSRNFWNRPFEKNVLPKTVESVGNLLAWAYPDRVGLRQDSSEDKGRHEALYLLSNGKSVRVQGNLSSNEMIVVPEVDAGNETGKAFLAAPADRKVLETSVFKDAPEAIEFEWVGWKARALRICRWGSLVVKKTGISLKDAQEALKKELLSRVGALGLLALPWNDTARQCLDRCRFWCAYDRSASSEKEKWSDSKLLDEVETWLFPFLDFSGGELLSGSSLHLALMQRIPWSSREFFEKNVPPNMVVPSGSRRPIHYGEDTPPYIEVRIQEVFGMPTTPLICNQPVVFHLLSPANRPLQITKDLASFWRNTYPEVRKEMRGRYPKHYWPENPLDAEPTSRAKPR